MDEAEDFGLALENQNARISDVFKKVIQLSRLGQVQEAFDVICSTSLKSHEHFQLLINLYEARCDAVAFIHANALRNSSGDHWALDAVLGHIGTMAGSHDVAAGALSRLRDKLRTLDADDVQRCQRMLASRLADDVSRLDPIAHSSLTARLLDVAKLALPELESIFPAGAQAVRRPARSSSSRHNLLKMPIPRTPSARCPRGVLVATLDEGPTDGLGARLERAFTSYGWQASLRTIKTCGVTSLHADLATLREVSLQQGPDLLLMVETAAELGLDQRLAFLSELRSRRAGMKIVLFCPDPWHLHRWPALRAAAARADHIWSPFPSLELWREDAFQSKMLFLPVPMGPARPLPQVDGLLRPTFSGRVHVWAWVRQLWLAAGRESGLELHNPSATRPETGGALDSYDRYLARLGISGAAVNLTMRVDGTRTLVGRSFEAPWAGALLLEEDNEDIHTYFEDGKHMLTFSTFPELMGLADLIRTDPGRVEEIRRSGHAYAIENYSDQRIVTALDHELWPSI